MALLFGLSIIFMAIAFLIRRPWTIAVPFVAWLGIYGLNAAGIVTADTSLASALIAGAVGALFAVAGIVFGNGQARRQPKA
jgi:hypothetical protein